MSKLDSNTITYAGVPVSRTEYLILKKLIDNQGKVVTKEELVNVEKSALILVPFEANEFIK